jgi:hypothetical protein
MRGGTTQCGNPFSRKEKKRREASEAKKKITPTEVRTQAKGFKVLCANHYTIGVPSKTYV